MANGDRTRRKQDDEQPGLFERLTQARDKQREGRRALGRRQAEASRRVLKRVGAPIGPLRVEISLV